MSSYDFIIDNIRFSYSSVSSYNTCPYGYKLNYIDKHPRRNNFFGQYGSFVHDCFEQFFSKNIDAFELSDYYRENYDKNVNLSPPVFLKGLNDKYMRQGLKFFDSFSFDINNYDILVIEDLIKFSIGDIKIVAKPDLVLREKSSGKIIQYDYKTSTPFRIDKRSGREIKDKKKLEGYSKQMFIYAYALGKHKDMQLDKTILLFTRLNREVTLPWTLEEENSAIDWMLSTIKKIKLDENFIADNSSQFFCKNLCNVREFCEYK